MAKKKSRRSGGFNMSAAVRDVVTENPALSGKEVEAEVKRRHPKEKINSNSLSVAFSSARKALGITKKSRKKSVKKRRPSARQSSALDITTLQAARKYVSEVGDVEVALEAVRQLRTLQVS